jgi:hypothetical protein
MAKNEVSKKGQFSKKDVPEMLDAVRGQIKALKERFGSDTGGLKNDDMGSPFGRISDMSDVPSLIRAIASVKGREASYKDAIKECDKVITLTKFPFKVCGTSPKNVIDAINRRIGEVTFKDELTKLEEAASYLEKHVSEDQKFENDMQKFMDVIKL